MGIVEIVSLAGTPLTTLGLAITIYQLRKTNNSAVAAKYAVNGLKTQLVRLDVSSESLKASKVIGHSIRLLRLGQWQHAADALFEAQVSLNRMVAASVDGYMDIYKTAIDEFLVAINDLEECAEKNVPYNKNPIIITLRKMINRLDEEYLAQNRKFVDV